MSKTKVDIVSGFLGAGKTTFIKRLLEEAVKGENIVLIENEFGEIGIDGGFLKNSGIEIREMSQGCICCSLVGDFASSLKEILTRYQPDRIIIEPSGVGKLSDVMKAIADVESELEVEHNSAVTVADAKKVRLYSRNFGEFFNNQIQFATTIVLSRTDIASQETIDAAVEIIKSLNPTAQIVTTPIKQLSGAKLLEILESPVDLKSEMLAELKDDEHEHHHDHEDEDEEHEHHHHDHEDEEHEHHHHDHEDEEHEHHHHDHEEEEHEHAHAHHHHHHHHHDGDEHDADEIFTSWGLENAPAMSEEELRTFLGKLTDTREFGDIIRAKGMVKEKDAESWLYFDMVPGEIEIRRDEPDITGKICVIGADVKEDALDKEFER